MQIRPPQKTSQGTVGEPLGSDHPRRGRDGLVPVTNAVRSQLGYLDAAKRRDDSSIRCVSVPFEPRRARCARYSFDCLRHRERARLGISMAANSCALRRKNARARTWPSAKFRAVMPAGVADVIGRAQVSKCCLPFFIADPAEPCPTLSAGPYRIAHSFEITVQ
jgi:hypothetical protein